MFSTVYVANVGQEKREIFLNIFRSETRKTCLSRINQVNDFVTGDAENAKWNVGVKRIWVYYDWKFYCFWFGIQLYLRSILIAEWKLWESIPDNFVPYQYEKLRNCVLRCELEKEYVIHVRYAPHFHKVEIKFYQFIENLFVKFIKTLNKVVFQKYKIWIELISTWCTYMPVKEGETNYRWHLKFWRQWLWQIVFRG